MQTNSHMHMQSVYIMRLVYVDVFLGLHFWASILPLKSKYENQNMSAVLALTLTFIFK